jgi:hypothetical protein
MISAKWMSMSMSRPPTMHMQLIDNESTHNQVCISHKLLNEWMNEWSQRRCSRLVVSLCVVVVHRLVTWMAIKASKAK